MVYQTKTNILMKNYSLLISLLFAPLFLFAQNWVTESKSCGSCGGIVSKTAKVGDRCPHCGVIWGRENTTRKSTTYHDYRPSYPSVPSYSPSSYSSIPSYSSTPSYSSSSTIPTALLPATHLMTHGVVRSNANLREQPYKGAYVLKVIPKGTKVLVTKKQGNWFYVSYSYLLEDFFGTIHIGGHSYKNVSYNGWVSCELIILE